MTALIVIWVISIAIPLAVLSGKWMAMSGWKLPFTRTISSTTKPLDEALHQARRTLMVRAADARHAALLKFHHFVYDDFIPWTQRRYRTIASSVYRFHRRLWSTLEYSRYSSHKVSDYLKQLSHERENGRKQSESAKGSVKSTPDTAPTVTSLPEENAEKEDKSVQ